MQAYRFKALKRFMRTCHSLSCGCNAVATVGARPRTVGGVDAGADEVVQVSGEKEASVSVTF